MSSVEYFITWNDHQRNVVGLLGRFLDKNKLVDCTIAAEGQYLKAHQLVLSACSPYFELLFCQEKKKNPIVILTDIKFEVLKSVIDFVYRGEISVPQSRLQDIVSAAECLQIKGLQTELAHTNARTGTIESLEVCRNDFTSLISPKHMRCSDNIGSDMQCTNLNDSSSGRKQSLNNSTSLCADTVLPEENAFPQHHTVMTNHYEAKMATFRGDTKYSVEPKEEVDVEDTPIWECEEENSTLVGLPSATVVKENRNELTPHLSTNYSNYRCASPPCFPENIPKIPSSKLLSTSATISTSADNASVCTFVPNVPTECSSVKVDDCSSHGQAQLAVITFGTVSELVAKSESGAMSAAFSSCGESLEEPRNKTSLEEKRSMKIKEEIIETDTDSIHNQENTNEDLGVAASENLPTAWPSFAIEASASSHSTVRIGEEVNVQMVKIKEPEIEEQHAEKECKSIDFTGSTVDNAVEEEQLPPVQVDECKVVEQEWRMGEVENTQAVDIAMKQNEEQRNVTLLSSHTYKPSGMVSLKCPLCPVCFQTVHRLQMHIKQVHKKQRSNRCEVCMATFFYRSQVKDHMRMHTNERPFECNVCRKTFRRSYYLTIHMRTHTGERPFDCKMCKKSFSDKSNLTTHMRAHFGDRPFQCSVCKKFFPFKYTLIEHMRVHTGERPFQCNVCKKFFRRTNSLTSHMRTHTGGRPFQCTECKLSFGFKSNLITHMRTHIGERPCQSDRQSGHLPTPGLA